MDPFEIDHVLPRSLGRGAGNLENLAYACRGCNGLKGSRTTCEDPVTGEVVRIFNPRVDRWADHFAWGTDYALVLGLTDVGRATVYALHLNRPGLVNLRLTLRSIGEHPPESV